MKALLHLVLVLWKGYLESGLEILATHRFYWLGNQVLALEFLEIHQSKSRQIGLHLECLSKVGSKDLQDSVIRPLSASRCLDLLENGH